MWLPMVLQNGASVAGVAVRASAFHAVLLDMDFCAGYAAIEIIFDARCTSPLRFAQISDVSSAHASEDGEVMFIL